MGATALGPDVIRVRDLPRGVPTILMLGGEEKGLPTNVKMACNHFVCILGLHIESNTKQVLGEVSENTQDNGISGGDDDQKKRNYLQTPCFFLVSPNALRYAAGSGE